MKLSKTYSEIGGTFQRPFSLLPDRVYEYIIDCYLVFIFLQPGVIGTTFYLYTRDTRKTRIEISRYTTLGPWNVTKPTKFFIHGFLDSSNKPWWIDMKNAMLEVVSINYY